MAKILLERRAIWLRNFSVLVNSFEVTETLLECGVIRVRTCFSFNWLFKNDYKTSLERRATWLQNFSVLVNSFEVTFTVMQGNMSLNQF
jgi:hypothetical protein